MRLPAEELDHELNVIPLIDILFNLLVFSLVAARFEQEERELQMPIALPEVASASPVSGRSGVTINITKEGKFVVNGKEYSKPHLQDLLVDVRKNNPHERVTIRADGRVPFEYVATVASFCRKLQLDYKTSAVAPED